MSPVPLKTGPITDGVFQRSPVSQDIAALLHTVPQINSLNLTAPQAAACLQGAATILPGPVLLRHWHWLWPKCVNAKAVKRARRFCLL